MMLAASAIAAVYKSRWQIELFFRRIRQNLKIKSFHGTSRNAVLTQIRVTMYYFPCCYHISDSRHNNATLCGN
ncbi:hypothetical protein ASB62_06420 [Chlorobium limicola]|uniref:Transposase IS4-like domain-containing protein n=1 Tax=Chlorobium limicola TaxID=1092 RepID=A0A101JG67_CHLLI|nr:hypothetical protein ASB62_06420 [Chlorobium limicola]